MGILDNLKEQAEQNKSEQLNKNKSAENIQHAYDHLIAPKMKQIYFYFKEFAQHLNDIKQPLIVPLYSKQFPDMGNFSQTDYKVNTDNSGGVVDNDKIHEVRLRFKYVGFESKEYIHHTDSKLEADQVQKFFTSHKLPVSNSRNLASKNNGALTFYITKNIPVVFNFISNPEQSNIILTISNHENFEERTVFINPEDINEAYLDKLARYILRKDSEFLNIDIDDSVRDKIRQRMAAERAEKEGEQKQEQEQEHKEKPKKSFFGKLFG